MYAVYRVLVALFLFVVTLYVIHADFLADEVRDLKRLMRLMHYGYWALFLLTIDFILQVAFLSFIILRK